MKASIGDIVSIDFDNVHGMGLVVGVRVSFSKKQSYVKVKWISSSFKPWTNLIPDDIVTVIPKETLDWGKYTSNSYQSCN